MRSTISFSIHQGEHKLLNIVIILKPYASTLSGWQAHLVLIGIILNRNIFITERTRTIIKTKIKGIFKNDICSAKFSINNGGSPKSQNELINPVLTYGYISLIAIQTIYSSQKRTNYQLRRRRWYSVGEGTWTFSRLQLANKSQNKNSFNFVLN